MPRQLDTLYSRSQTLATPSPHLMASGSSTGLPGEASPPIKAVVADDHGKSTEDRQRELQFCLPTTGPAPAAPPEGPAAEHSGTDESEFRPCP